MTDLIETGDLLLVDRGNVELWMWYDTDDAIPPISGHVYPYNYRPNESVKAISPLESSMCPRHGRRLHTWIAYINWLCYPGGGHVS